MYCLVVTDDYSRFTWVFFLSTKDETSGILKSFITKIENLVDHKTADPPFSQDPKSSQNNRFQTSSDSGKKVDEDPIKESECRDQEEEDNVNNTNNVNAASTDRVNTVSENIKPKKVIHALKDPSWIEAMQEELLQFKLQEYLTLVDLPNKKRAIATKCVFRNKKHERGIVIRNKARLVTQGYTREKGIDYDEVFAPVERINAIRLFLAYASFKDFMMYQMDVKSTFVYGKIEKEVYVCQPPGFEDPDFLDKVYKVEKALYGLHQAPRAWYLKGQPKFGLWYPKESLFDLVAYIDSDYARESLYRKSTTEGCKFLKCRLISWQCKKQTVVENSTTEAEYVAASSCCGKVLWIQNQLLDYGTMAFAIIFLATNQKFKFSNDSFKSMVKNLDNVNKFLMYPRKTKRKDTELPQTSGPTTNIADEAVSEEMNDSLERAITTASSLEVGQDSGNINKTKSKATLNEPSSIRTSLGINTPLSDEGSLKLKELTELCTNLHNRVLDLETTKTTQAMEIDSLKRRVKKLEKKKRLRNHKHKILYKVSLTPRVDFSNEASLSEDASKQERIIHDIDVDEGITLVDENAENQERFNDQEDAEMLFDVVDDLREQGTTTTTTAATIITAASIRPKAKGLVIHKQEQAHTLRVSAQQLSQVKLQAEEEEKEEERLAREKSQQIKEVNIAWDDIQAKIDADYQLAQRLQAEKQEELTDEEKARLFVQFLEKRRKFFAAKRTVKRRNRPPTRAQQRSIMCTYLKNMEGWKTKSLKNKSFVDIQELFNKAMKRVNTFVDYMTELVVESSKEAEVEVTKGSLKRDGEELEQENAKKQKMEMM
uniref:Putative ribonuclease H-like domain-containing protein n=1 Tax=Tanacetum cinerariifolium TaxID=118510 RepID=A0A699H2A0_TANCI|nr:putative ribonuclease H-like domain-containing protein [Tanacetum cinerariifolium]